MRRGSLKCIFPLKLTGPEPETSCFNPKGHFNIFVYFHLSPQLLKGYDSWVSHLLTDPYPFCPFCLVTVNRTTIG